jgi:hypothetical protein
MTKQARRAIADSQSRHGALLLIHKAGTTSYSITAWESLFKSPNVPCPFPLFHLSTLNLKTLLRGSY